MRLFDTIVDILSSLASLIAIIAVLVAWYNSARSCLKVVRVVIYRKKDESTYILMVKNRQPHTVQIKNIRCFTRRSYKVEQKNNCAPEFHSSLNYADSLFHSNETKEIAANGYTDIRYMAPNYTKDVTQLLFSMNTSHGFLLLKCKNIELINVGEIKIYGIEFSEDYQSKLKALKQYFWLRIKYFFRKNK